MYRLKDMREVEKSHGVAKPLLPTETTTADDKRVRETLQWMIHDEVGRKKKFYFCRNLVPHIQKY